MCMWGIEGCRVVIEGSMGGGVWGNGCVIYLSSMSVFLGCGMGTGGGLCMCRCVCVCECVCVCVCV